jgi:hypothetical protein
MHAERVGLGMGLVVAHPVHADDVVEQVRQPRVAHHGAQHLGVAIAQDAGGNAARLQGRQHLAGVGKGVQMVVLGHQLVNFGIKFGLPSVEWVIVLLFF